MDEKYSVITTQDSGNRDFSGCCCCFTLHTFLKYRAKQPPREKKKTFLGSGLQTKRNSAQARCNPDSLAALCECNQKNGTLSPTVAWGQWVGCCRSEGDLWGCFCCPPAPGSCPELLCAPRWLYPSPSPAHWHIRHICMDKRAVNSFRNKPEEKTNDMRGHKRSGLDYNNFIPPWAAPDGTSSIPRLSLKTPGCRGVSQVALGDLGSLCLILFLFMADWHHQQSATGLHKWEKKLGIFLASFSKEWSAAPQVLAIGKKIKGMNLEN